MSDQTEALDAILAEMRDGIHTGRADIIDAMNERLRSYADRIKAAVERERAEFRRQLRNEIQINDCLATVRPQLHNVGDVIPEAAKERAHEIELAKLRATGNAAALREALERSTRRLRGVVRELPLEMQKYVNADIRDNDAALSAPARNCDRFKTLDEAREAFQDLRGHKILADVDLWDSMDEAGALVRWLFATAEGGDHA